MTNPLAFDPAHPELGWQPAIPEPLWVGFRLRKARCDCGQTFKRRLAFEEHWRAEHGQP